MPLYEYQAFDSTRNKKTGLIEAHGEKEAKGILRDQGLMVTKLLLKTTVSSRQNLRGNHLQAFTLQLSQLINAGVPLYESLVAIEEQYRNESSHRILLSLCEQIKSGAALSEAMTLYPESFDKLYRALIAAGESIGALGDVLEKLSTLLSKQMKLKRQITTTMIYPGVLGSFSLLIIAMLLGFVVPSIEGIFADRPLNKFTSIVLATSHVFRDYWWVYLPISVITIVYAIFKIKSPAGHLWIQRNFLKIPLIKTLMIQTAIARFCRTLGTLQQGGLSIIDSLRISREVMGNVVLEEEVLQAETKIIEGSSLSAELKGSRYIPSIVTRMLAVGEESGSTNVMLNKLAEMYEEEVEKNVDRIMALSQPIILIFMGGIIGTVLLAILLPLTDMSSFSM